MRVLVALVLVLVVACSSPTEQVGCDLFLGSAVVRGVARDFDGMPIPGARVNIELGRVISCRPGDPAMVTAAETDDGGRYEVVVKLGNAKGNWCVFGYVAGSDSVSSGTVRLHSSCEPGSPDTLDFDLVVPLSSYIPPDLLITMYRLHGFNNGPQYSVSVNAAGTVTFNGIDNTSVTGNATGSVDPIVAARLYRDLRGIGYDRLADMYGESNCDPYVYDTHYCRTSLTAAGAFKQVAHDHGCIGLAVLDSLTRIECRIDSVLSTIQWTGDVSWPCR